MTGCCYHFAIYLDLSASKLLIEIIVKHFALGQIPTSIKNNDFIYWLRETKNIFILSLVSLYEALEQNSLDGHLNYLRMPPVAFA